MVLFPAATLELVAAIAVAIVGIYLFGTWNYNEFKKRKLPFLKPTFFVGNMGSFLFGKTSLGDLSLNRYNKYKGHRAFGIFRVSKPAIVVRDPELLKMIAVKYFDHFTDHMTIIEEEDDVLFGKFMFFLKGSRWKSMRTLLSPAFTSSKMKAMFSLVTKCGEQLGDFLDKQCKGFHLFKTVVMEARRASLERRF